ncbi:hypothetical protein ACM42_23545 [Bradyrhizobium sp. CCBAU 25338]|nr:hypothetical protein [Bradyrhizobium sp. CCBAU 25338]
MDGSEDAALTRVPDKLQRVSVAAQSRDPGRHGTTTTIWAPALQRTVEGTLRCVRGTRMEFGARSLLLVVARSSCDEAIQTVAVERFWFASAFAEGFGGQVAALAMMEDEAAMPLFQHAF